uniref:Uncharacterized protein n=1 Tax=Picea glauca TaxID=3330 RepID=A0A101M3Y9_PICGL|nr:hypothetical protein ABT39_MTgene404 [Picea glauca]
MDTQLNMLWLLLGLDLKLLTMALNPAGTLSSDST